MLYDVYLPNIWVINSRRMRWAGHVAHMGKSRGACRMLLGRLEGRRPLGRLRHRWWEVLKWIFSKWGGE